MNADDELSPANVHYYAWHVAEGNAAPEDARRLLATFVSQAKRDPARVDPELTRHVADCIGAFLNGEKLLVAEAYGPSPKPARAVKVRRLEQAFGLRRLTRGQPPVTQDECLEAAAQVLREMLKGNSLEDAAAAVGDERRAAGERITSETELRGNWARYKRDAWHGLRVMRLLRQEPGGWWTPDEQRALFRLYRNEPGFVWSDEHPPGSWPEPVAKQLRRSI